MAHMAHFSFPYYFTIPNSEIRILNSEIRTTCFVYMFSTLENASGGRKVVVIILFYILELLSGIFLYYEFQSSGLSWFNWWVSFAPEFQCCYFCESSCLFYLSFNFDFCVSKIMHL